MNPVTSAEGVANVATSLVSDGDHATWVGNAIVPTEHAAQVLQASAL